MNKDDHKKHKPPKINIYASNVAAFCGLHKYKSSYCARQLTLSVNPWVTYWNPVVIKPRFTDVEQEIVDSGSLNDDISQTITVTNEEFLNKEEYTDLILASETDELTLPATTPINQELSENLKQYIRIERGNVGESIAFTLFNSYTKLNGKNDQKIAKYSDKYFKIVGRLDISIYSNDSAGKLIGLGEIKTRLKPPTKMKDKLKSDASENRIAYDLRQLVCYWRCFPNLQYYYFVQYFNGKIEVELFTSEELVVLWNEMYPILKRRSKRIIKNYLQHLLSDI